MERQEKNAIASLGLWHIREELEEDGDDPFYYLAEYEEIDRRDFDEESLELFGNIDL